MCKILQIETATGVCSVSIADGGKIISLKEISAGRSHAAVLSVFINELLVENEILPDSLDAVAVSIGPGSYTGLRIGVSTAKGLCYGSGIPLIAVQTLQSLYAGFRESVGTGNTLFVPMIDARRMEVYTAIFDGEGRTIQDTHALVVENDSFKELLRKDVIYFFGNGADKLSGIINHPNAKVISGFQISSAFMTPIALDSFIRKDFASVAYLEPYYLKDFIAIVPKRKVLP